MPLRFARRAVAVAVVAAALAASAPASAEPSVADKAAAEGLFEQGRNLMREGKYADACPKFVESQRLDPGVGTLLFLGECYERTGRLASAWATFGEARSAARIAGDSKRDALAQQRYEKLDALVPRVIVKVNEVPGLVVTIGDTPLAKGTWGAPLPVDPGDETLHAHAPGYRDATIALHVERGETKTIEVAPLEKLVAPTDPPPNGNGTTPPHVDPPPIPEPAPVRPWQRPVGAAVLGVGAAGIVAGAIFGAFAFSTWADARDACPANRCSSQDGIDASDRAHLWGNLSTGFFVAGGVLAAAGAVMLFTAPKRHVALALTPRGDGALFALSGAF